MLFLIFALYIMHQRSCTPIATTSVSASKTRTIRDGLPSLKLAAAAVQKLELIPCDRSVEVQLSCSVQNANWTCHRLGM